MFLRLFKGNNPGVIFLIAIISAAVWITAFMHPSAPITGSGIEPMPLFGLLAAAAHGSNMAATAMAFSMVVILAFLLVNFNTTSFFINERTYLPALMFFLAGGLFPDFQALNPALPASVFLMLAIMRIIDGYRKAGIANNSFDAGILISMGSLFYANLIWFGLLVIIGIAIIRTINATEVLISLLGLLTPYLLLFGIYYVIGKDLKALLTLIASNLFMHAGGYLFTRLTVVALIFSAVIIIVSLAYLFSFLNSKKIKSRKTFSLLIWTFLIAVSVYFALPSVSVEIVWIIGIPVSYFLTHYFIFHKKKLIPEIIFSLLLLLVLIIQVSYGK